MRLKMCSAGIVCALLASAGSGAPRVVASEPGDDVIIQNNDGSASVSFSGVDEPVSGFAITALWEAVVADEIDGMGPWSIDVGIVVTAPDGERTVVLDQPWTGDTTIADFPIADGATGFGGAVGNGTFTLDFDNNGLGAPWVSALRGVEYHLLADGPDATHVYEGTTESEVTWARPYFIAGVSGLGPVMYHAVAFEVAESGLYTFESVLENGENHFTLLYAGAFDPDQPLVGLLDYGLGNGSSPFGVPRGTSAFSTLLFEGRTYWWVTSQWDRWAAVSAFENTITGPGAVLVDGEPPCRADVNGDGEVGVQDLIAFLGAFGGRLASAEFDGEEGITVGDLIAFLRAFGAGCPA